MQIAFVRLFLLLMTLTVSIASAMAQQCDKNFLAQLVKDKALTSLQRQTAADKACIGKVITVTGIVADVLSKDTLETLAADGLKYGVGLSPAPQCGDMLRMQKG